MGKVPPQAKRVFKGVIFDVYQWEQELYDGKSTATFELLKRADTVGIIPVHDGKILLTRDEQPHRPAVTTLPGGRVDPGEAPLETAKRELLEETGYEAEHWELHNVYSPSHKIEWQVHYFIAQGLRRVAEPDPGVGELVELRWVTFDELLAATKQPDFQGEHFVLDLYRMTPDELTAFRKRLGV